MQFSGHFWGHLRGAALLPPHLGPHMPSGAPHGPTMCIATPPKHAPTICMPTLWVAVPWGGPAWAHATPLKWWVWAFDV